MFELKIINHFSAAHQLEMVSKKCENLHGHNWKVEVFVIGESLDQSGVLMDFGELKKHVNEIMDTLDHKFLNDLEYFNKDMPPSSENIVLYITQRLQGLIDHIPNAKVSRVSIWESHNSCATYWNIPIMSHQVS